MESIDLVKADARDRAWRTFVQGLATDIFVAVVALLAVSVSDLQWTKSYWLALGAAVAKTAIVAGVSYAYRKAKPPALV